MWVGSGQAPTFIEVDQDHPLSRSCDNMVSGCLLEWSSTAFVFKKQEKQFQCAKETWTKHLFFTFKKQEKQSFPNSTKSLTRGPLGKTLAQVQQSPSSCMINKNTDGRFCVEMKFGTNSKSNPPIIHWKCGEMAFYFMYKL